MRHLGFVFRGLVCIGILGLTLACSGWWSPEPMPTLNYQLQGAEGQALPNDTRLVDVLTRRLVHGGFPEVVVTQGEGEVTVVIHDTGDRATPLHLFEPGLFTVHRVDALQSRGADRVARQILANEQVRTTDPPEKVWRVLRDASLLPPDRWAYFSQTPDGREELLFVQTNAFLTHDLFTSSRAVTSEHGCHVEAEWSERLSGVLSDSRARASKQRVALMMDGELLGFRPMDSLWHAERPFRLDAPNNAKTRGGRNVWSVTENTGTWCRDVSAVFQSGPIPVALRVGEITAISP